MSVQAELDFEAGLANQATGRASALSGIGQANADTIARIITALTRGGATVTSDDAWDLLPPATLACLQAHPCAMSAIFKMLAADGRIERTGETVVSTRKNARGRRIAIWRGR